MNGHECNGRNIFMRRNMNDVLFKEVTANVNEMSFFFTPVILQQWLSDAPYHETKGMHGE